ncbi:hypothetical protein D3C75_1200220 [compost metagenome]
MAHLFAAAARRCVQHVLRHKGNRCAIAPADLTCAGHDLSSQHAQQAALAGAVVADQGDACAGRQAQVHAAEKWAAVEVKLYIVQSQHVV